MGNTSRSTTAEQVSSSSDPNVDPGPSGDLTMTIHSHHSFCVART